MMTATQNLAPGGVLAESDQKRLALGYLQDAWAEAVHDGIESDYLAQTALFLALAELIATYGEEPAARYADNLGSASATANFPSSWRGSNSVCVIAGLDPAIHAADALV